MADEDLRRAFEELRSDDARIAPDFKVPEHDRLRRLHWRSGVIAMAALAIVLVGIVFVSLLPQSKVQEKEESMVIANPFDQYADAISCQLLAATPVYWEARSDILLDFDVTLAQLK